MTRGTTIRYFGDYELQKELGRGGMGVVYKARQASLNRPVALKMIKAGVLAGDEELRRFQTEAEAVALLDHAGIVPVYEVGEHDGQKYFSMKLVEGGNLAQQLAAFQVNPRAAATLLAETAEAIHHAHMRGILHRDLKPANILVDGEGHPHVTDFGLAKRVEADVEMTASGAILGTPAYMSPEQAAGRRGTITTATDVYGLGAILYALLTGRAPFKSDSVADTLAKVREQPPEPPSKLNSRTPRDLETICLKCLDKDPRRRYSSAQALADDLHKWLDSRPITARRVRPAERVWLWCKRRPAIAALSAATLLALVGGTAGIFAVQARANTNLRSANTELRSSNIALDQQRTRAEQREQLAIDAVKKFRDAVANNDELRNNAALEPLRKTLLKEPLAFFKLLRTSLQSDGDTKPESIARLAAASFELGDLTYRIGDMQDALLAYQESLAIRQKLADANPTVTRFQSDLAGSHRNIGNLQRETGEPGEALNACQSALTIWQKLADAHPTDTEFQRELAGSNENIGIVLLKTGKPGEALKAYESALAIRQKLADAHPTDTGVQHDLAASHHNIGALLSDTGKPGEALKAYESALAIRQSLVDANPTVTQFQGYLADTYNNIGHLLGTTGKPGEALKAYESALAISQKLAKDFPTVTEFQSALANTYNNIAVVLKKTGKPAEALQASRSALAIFQQLADANPTANQFQSDLADSHQSIGYSLSETGKPAEELKEYELALPIRERLVREHPESPDYAGTLGGLLGDMAAIDLEAGRFDAARDRLQQAIVWQGKALAVNPRHPRDRQFLGHHLRELIKAARGLGDFEGEAVAERELAKLRDSDPAMMALDSRLAAIAKGKPAKDNAERLALAPRAYEKAMYATAAQLWAEALAADPNLYDDREAQHPYNAACAATLAAAGQGKDEPPLEDIAKAKLRSKALDWLKAELTSWTKLLETADPKQRASIAQTLRHWQKDTDLTSIREEKELAKLPEDERAAFQSIWAEVEALIQQAQPATR